MSTPISDLNHLLHTLDPVLHEGVYAFACLTAGADLRDLEPLATFQEDEGLTVVLREETALARQVPVLFRAAWITLRVHSDLQAVGLTAAFSQALAEARISCNVIAGACHDHLFVPVDEAARALAVLRELQRRGGA
ncbi:MAG: ACT domain-containing protein [Geothrix sp.]|uniref:ACT domain-containing protein n=1 Tax=Geothrix sp. TaxID=1962974 RepID=UPI00181097D6|nr:ACT domain-containing protein [Geothrix sp.]NWJ41383.1 ACT domain-containing protein [Geothrix sp.]WIL20630.1 MAG: ACT domain-containing protein [Geothrix sp.]